MATDAAGFEPPANTISKRKKSFFEEEEIVVKPSTELIPDEYENCTNDNILIHIFRTTYEEDFAEDVFKSLQDIDCKLDAEKNLHYLSKNSEFLEDLESIKKQSINKSALLLIFIGFFDKTEANGTILLMDDPKETKNVNIKDVWNKFTANACPELKNKPKIFIFCTSPKPEFGIQSDSMRHRRMDFDKVYDFPAESDILIVYKRVDDIVLKNKEEFLNQLCYNIKTFSKKYDIIDLVSYIHNDGPKFVPIILISTLTRKFYLTPNNERDHYLAIAENHSNLEESLKKIKEDIQKLQDSQKKKKDKMFSFSFKKKNEEKPKIKKREESIKEQPKSPKVSTVSSPPLLPNRLSSGSLGGTRPRLQSETDSSATKKKPIWRN